jgi:RNA 2',3'-cyclic 3'-phosphodiesterase
VAEQLSFFEVKEPKHRLFFAFLLSTSAAARAVHVGQEQREKHGLRGRVLDASRMHITAVHLGDYEEYPKEIDAQARVVGSNLFVPAFDAEFDRVGSFAGQPRNRPLVLRGGEGVAGIEAFQRALHVEMKKAGLGRWAKPYTPHVTLLYDDAIVEEQIIEPIRWTVTELVLIYSVLGETKHVHLARWPLQGVGPAA